MNQKGFSLVEMMIAVGIIGVLTAIAVPMYQQSSARARDAEAKADLSGIYASEKNYLVEAASYTTCLSDIGFNVSSQSRYYEVGFASGNATRATCGTGTTDCSKVEGVNCSKGIVALSGGDPLIYGNAFSSNSIANTTAGYPKDANFPPTGASLAHFSAGAAGNVSQSSAIFDQWAIDDTGNVSNVQSGL